MQPPEEQREGALIDGPSQSWALVRGALVAVGFALTIVIAVVASSIETWLVAAELCVMVVAFWLSPRIGRPASLHIVAGSFLLYQTIVLDLTRGTPNMGVVWFLLVPCWAILWGRPWHVILWVPATVLGIGWTAWRALPSDPLWGHPLSLVNLLAIVVLSSAIAVGFHRERQRRERALAAATARVEDETRERETAEAKVRRAEFARDRLLAMLSHELRSPMTSLALTADLLAEQTDVDPSASEPLGRLQSSARATLRTLDDILDLVRLEEGVVPSRNEPFMLLELLEDAAEVVVPRAREAGLALVVDVDPSLAARWSGDRARLRQVLLNLLGNAFKHTREGGVRVVARASETGTGLEFSVEDTGVGIADDVVRDVFEPWRQGRELGEVRGGVGLGLSISRDFVEAMGGTIWVDSRAAGGTRLCFRVDADALSGPQLGDRDRPREPPKAVRLVGGSSWARARAELWAEVWNIAIDPEASAAVDLDGTGELQWRTAELAAAFVVAGGGVPPTEEPAPTRFGVRPSLRGKRVLVVDDDSTVRDVVARVLQRAGCEVVQAADGGQAEAALRSNPFDLVLLDLEMPGRTGLELLTAMQGTEDALPPVVVLSGSVGARGAAIEAGARAFVTKPVRAASLLELAGTLTA